MPPVHLKKPSSHVKLMCIFGTNTERTVMGSRVLGRRALVVVVVVVVAFSITVVVVERAVVIPLVDVLCSSNGVVEVLARRR